ncbi:MAG: thiamine phosphate synthase [Deltaproteobacteria bacterium]|nr:thiamine phosphate synthase [Deltaproteobacteria bacterium]
MSASGDAYRGLHVLVDDDPRWGRDPVEQARAACRARVPVVQLRAKRAGDRVALAWAREIRALTRAAGSRFVVNDRFDLALLADADAVHLGQDDLSPSAIPRAVRARLAVGRSTHTPEQLAAARDEDVDYVAYGPVFGTRSKDSPFAARGLEALADAVRLAAPRPLVAIGGLERDHLPLLRALGVAGVAVISAVAAAPEPEQAAAALIDAFDARPA